MIVECKSNTAEKEQILGKRNFKLFSSFLQLIFIRKNMNFRFPFFFCCRLPRDKPEIVVTFMNFADLDSTTN